MLYRRVQFHHGELDQTLTPTFLTFIFKIDFTPNPNPSINWSDFARCDQSLSPNLEYLETGIVFMLYRRVQFHHGELDQTPSPTFLTFIFKIDFTPNPNPSIKWSHFARCDRSLSPNPEDLETGGYNPNSNPSIKWSDFARCDRSLSPNPEDLETDRKEQLHDEKLFHTLLPTMQNLNFNARFYPKPNPSMNWSHFARCCWSISPNPEDLETGIVFNLFGREQFHHRELVQTPFPTMITVNFKSDFTPNPNLSIKWSDFARFDRTLGSNPTNLETGIVFILDRKEQLHDEKLFHTLLPTMQNLNFNARFHPKPNPSMKWSHFARCRWSISPNPEDLETDRREQLHDEQLFHTRIPTVLNLKFKARFHP
ncbi:unnamed protein product [Clavelina lepadiformis]|uniref:Uncharacterized protein n=1 Tax=Clavelina lepadiformis TaxID=159417 RepID=A0ABP0F5V9_CLALP